MQNDTAAPRSSAPAPPAAAPKPRRRARPAKPPVDRRGQILAAAARLFAEFGFETTSVRQIAAEVKILAGSLYHHFETKEDILHGILRGPSETISHEILRISQCPADPEQRLIASIIMRFHQNVAQWEVQAIIQHDAQFFRRHEAFFYVQAAKSNSFRLLKAMLEDGMAAGLFRPDIDTYLMIGTIARLISSAANWFRTGDIFSANKPEAYTLQNVINFHIDIILRLVRLPSRLSAPIPLEFCEALALPNAAA